MKKASLATLSVAIALASSGAFATNDGNQPVSDAVITTKVKAQLVKDDTTKARHINVTTQNGVVTLSGAVDSAMEKEAAGAHARAIEGVTSVDNRLTVK